MSDGAESPDWQIMIAPENCLEVHRRTARVNWESASRIQSTSDVGRHLNRWPTFSTPKSPPRARTNTVSKDLESTEAPEGAPGDSAALETLAQGPRDYAGITGN